MMSFGMYTEEYWIRAMVMRCRTRMRIKSSGTYWGKGSTELQKTSYI